jgi:hypothetical protein
MEHIVIPPTMPNMINQIGYRRFMGLLIEEGRSLTCEVELFELLSKGDLEAFRTVERYERPVPGMPIF